MATPIPTGDGALDATAEVARTEPYSLSSSSRTSFAWGPWASAGRSRSSDTCNAISSSGAGASRSTTICFDIPTAIICIVTLVVLARVKRVPEPVVIVAAGVVGVPVQTMGQP